MRSILLFLFILLTTAAVFAQVDRHPKFIDFNVNGVRLGDSESLVIERLGKPVSRVSKRVDLCGIEEILMLHYRGLEVQLDRDLEGKWNVLEMIVSSPTISVEPTIRIGAGWGEVQKKFGEPHSESTSEASLGFLTRDNDIATFQFRKRKLAKIRLWVNPC